MSMDYAEADISAVLGDIVERNVEQQPPSSPSKSTQIGSAHQKLSSFASKRSQFLKDSAAHAQFKSSSSHCQNQNSDVQAIKHDVSKENHLKLSHMSQQEITEERNRLIAKLDPNMVAFIQNKAKSNIQTGKEENIVVLNTEETAEKTVFDALPFEIDPDWLHMNVLEKNKLQWIKPVMDPKLGAHPKKSDYTDARFDLQGCLCSLDDKTGSAPELYQHADSPQKPGYTLAELVPLCRSAAPNQRLLALRTVSRVVARAKAGLFDDIIKPALIKTLLKDSALCTLIRLGLDEKNLQLCTAHLHLLASVLCGEFDEIVLDRTLVWPYGLVQPMLNPVEGTDQTDTEEDNDNKHEELCNQDVIKGLLEMDVLTRLRYMLDVLKPQSSQFIVDLFNVLIRICRHTPVACAKVLLCPGLLDNIVETFVPDTWIERCEANSYPAYDLPYCAALKLIRLIASASNTNARTLVQKYGLTNKLIHYLLLQPECCKMSPQDACRCVVEAYRILSVLAAYGLCHEVFSDLFVELQSQLQLVLRLPLETLASGNRDFAFDRAAYILGALSVCMNSSNFTTRRSSFLESTVFESVKGLLHTAKMLFERVLVIFNADTTVCDNESFSNLVVGLLGAFTSYYKINPSGPEFDLSEFVFGLKPIMKIQSDKMCQKTSDDSGFSLLTWENVSEVSGVNMRDADCLPSVLSVTHSAVSLQPSVRQSSPIPFLTNYALFILATKNGKCAREFLNAIEPYVARYLDRKAADCAHANYFAKFETNLLFAIQLVMEFVKIETGIRLSLILKLPSDLQSGQLGMLVQLFGSTCSLLTTIVQEECLGNRLLSKACDSIKLIKESLLNTGEGWAPRVVAAQSLDVVCGFSPGATTNLTGTRQLCVDECGTRISSILNAFQPSHAIFVYMQALKKCDRNFGTVTNEQRQCVLSSLMYFYMVYKACPSFVEQHYGVESVYCRICEIFLIGSDYYMDEEINEYMEVILHEFLLVGAEKRNCFCDNSCVIGLESFSPMYEVLLADFQCNSYGNSLYAQYLLLPALSSRNTNLFNKLWTDELQAIRVITLNEQDLVKFPEKLVNFDLYDCVGMDAVISVVRTVTNHIIHPVRNAALYQMAVAWLKSFVEKELPNEHKKLQGKIREKVLLL